jgi:hypothetical protein
MTVVDVTGRQAVTGEEREASGSFRNVEKRSNERHQDELTSYLESTEGTQSAPPSPGLGFGNADGSPVTADQLAGLEVFVCGDLIAGSWTRLANAMELVDGQVRILDPDAAGQAM